MSATTSTSTSTSTSLRSTTRVSFASAVSCCSRAVSHKNMRAIVSPVNYWLLAAMLIIFTICLSTSTHAMPTRVEQGGVRSEFNCKTPNVNNTELITEANRIKLVSSSIAKLLVTYEFNTTKINMTIVQLVKKYSLYPVPLNYSLAPKVSEVRVRSSGNETFGYGMTKMEQIVESVTKIYLLVHQIMNTLTTPVDNALYDVLNKKLFVLKGKAQILGGCKWNRTLANSLTSNKFRMQLHVALEVYGLTQVLSEYYAGMRESKTA